VPNVVGGIKHIIAVISVIVVRTWGTQKIDVGKRNAKAHPLLQIPITISQ